MRLFLCFFLASIASAPVRAEWTAANPEVAAAAKTAPVAEVLEAVSKIDAAIVAGDKAGFIGAFADEAVVNSPFNNIATRAMAEARFQAGVINYEYLRRSIEHAAPRGDAEVVLMGEESYRPRAGAPNAGKIVKRRFTDIWRRTPAGWRLSVRQATIISAQ